MPIEAPRNAARLKSVLSRAPRNESNPVAGLTACNADGLDSPVTFLRLPAPDWQIMAKTISALEYARVASLANRPFEITDRYGEVWVFG